MRSRSSTYAAVRCSSSKNRREPVSPAPAPNTMACGLLSAINPLSWSSSCSFLRLSSSEPTPRIQGNLIKRGPNRSAQGEVKHTIGSEIDEIEFKELQWLAEAINDHANSRSVALTPHATNYFGALLSFICRECRVSRVIQRGDEKHYRDHCPWTYWKTRGWP